ncbi:MAG: hypothetical protein ACP5N0_08450 [Methanosarcina sp.]|jgi:hypothetical protein|uniref:hypothetical protein n=1 Tax=Methanosarcina sp. TaxID=2213 RepID=UPI003BB6FE12
MAIRIMIVKAAANGSKIQSLEICSRRMGSQAAISGCGIWAEMIFALREFHSISEKWRIFRGSENLKKTGK